MVVVAGYVATCTLLDRVLRASMKIGVAYGRWAALDGAGTAVLSYVFFAEPLNGQMLVGIGVITAGVLCVELGGQNAMGWLFLSPAIVFEIVGTMSLRMASSGRPRYYALVVGDYVLSYAMLSVALAFGMPLGVADGSWSALGVAATALLGRLLFSERFTWNMGPGVVLVMAGA